MRWRDTFAQEIVLESDVQEILDQLELDAGQGVFVELQLRLDRGHLILEQPVALRADPAKIVVEPDRVEPADASVVEQAFDLGEIAVGAVGEAALLFW